MQLNFGELEPYEKSMKTCYLALQKGSLQEAIYPLLGSTTIGRSPDSTIHVSDPTVSRNHARITFHQGAWIVEDLGSANGIIFAGKRVQRIPLSPGDTFQIGGVAFQYIEKEVPEEGIQLFDTVEILSATTEDRAFPSEDGDPETWPRRIQQAVAAIPFFSHLEEAERKQLTDTASLHVFNAGEVIIREGDPGRSVYVILDGWVRVFARDYHGKELELAILGASQFFGEMSFLSGNPRSSSVAAIDTSLLIELSYTSMRKLLQQHPSVKEMFLKYYHDRLGTTREKRSQAAAEERRRRPRLQERVAVQLATLVPTPEGEASSTSWEGYSMNISTSGIQVAVPDARPDAFKTEGRVRLTIELPAPGGDIRTLGVIRSVQAGEKEESMTVVRIEFVGVGTTDTRKLNDFIYGENHTNP